MALLFIANYLIYLFVSPSETEVVAQAHQFLLINAFFYIPLVLVNTIRFTIQGMGFSGFAMFAGVAEMIARSLIGLVFVPIFGFSAPALQAHSHGFSQMPSWCLHSSTAA